MPTFTTFKMIKLLLKRCNFCFFPNNSRDGSEIIMEHFVDDANYEYTSNFSVTFVLISKHYGTEMNTCMSTYSTIFLEESM